MYVTVIKKTLRVPVVDGPEGNGSVVARQLDTALMQAGFKLSKELLIHLSSCHPVMVTDMAQWVLAAVRELVGDHRQHNVYFRDFPMNVPHTLDFWWACIQNALADPRSAGVVAPQLAAGVVNLLDLPLYGRYQHTYEEMLAAHDELIPAVKDRLTVLHLGGSLVEEAQALYVALAGSRIPLNEADQGLLAELTQYCLDGAQPEVIPVRENRALVNRIRLAQARPLLVDTVTDVLRLAAALSDGDISLSAPTRFRSFRRMERRGLLEALDRVIAGNPAKLADVSGNLGPWKRLGERLHPHEFSQWPGAQNVFAVARGNVRVRSLTGQAELALADGDIGRAATLMAKAPGLLMRNLDRLLRLASPSEIEQLLDIVRAVIGKVSGRVILSVREHLQNRTSKDVARAFVNRKGRAWATDDTREPLDAGVLEQLLGVLDDEMLRRLPVLDHLVVDPAVLPVALPLSDKTKASGFGVLPRGSVTPVTGDLLRFFVYWKERARRTDFDLSVLLLDEHFESAGHVSYTYLGGGDDPYVHSGDITEAHNGATEMIDVDLSRLRAHYIVPQVLDYTGQGGDGFEGAEESFFGFMERDLEQEGQPFEPRTVRMKSELRGRGKVSLPLVFMRGSDGQWVAKWLHLYLRGHASFNRVETHRVSTALLSKMMVERQYLTLEYVVGLLRRKAALVTMYSAEEAFTAPVTFIGLERPEGLPEGSEVYALDRLAELLPA